MTKKNRVSIFGKTFHVTPAGKVLPLGSKNNWFTKCMKEGKGDYVKGENIGSQGIERNISTFTDWVSTCKAREGRRGRTPIAERRGAIPPFLG